MSNTRLTDGVVSARLEAEEYKDNFTDLHAPLNTHEALVAADRCYFCYDAPCMDACPTSIDIPLFIRQISTGNNLGSAKTIFDQNIMGGMCARVCPTETLCEEVCVREVAEGKPVKIGQLQRYATDAQMKTGIQPYMRAKATGKKVVVVGAGPTGLACAHRLAMYGHEVVIYEARAKAGGLNEFGIASYKSVDGFAQKEVEWLLSIGGISIECDKKIGDGVKIADLQDEFDAVYLGIGLGGVNALGLGDETQDNALDAVDFISDLRQAGDLANLPIGRNVVVIGGGMTAVDAAVQAKLLGAESVTMVYRRGKKNMSASVYEQELATSKGVRIIYNAAPVRIQGNGAAEAVEFAYTEIVDGKLHQTNEVFALPADQIFTAIGQTLDADIASLDIEGGKIKVLDSGRTSLANVWAGGDCATGGDDLTVTAVAEGRDAAEDIHTVLTSNKEA
ncbi:MAG: NAD(P)-dependent oxidoreductase [Rhizobiales bacterium]|nr:NAD(P)-dependent oxidoreductase [Hyphomicrobiales bacterium]NRB15555.1 NAD(P)-dependent oxidoreductase [Hyphomicrobiales bacterium]